MTCPYSACCVYDRKYAGYLFTILGISTQSIYLFKINHYYEQIYSGIDVPVNYCWLQR